MTDRSITRRQLLTASAAAGVIALATGGAVVGSSSSIPTGTHSLRRSFAPGRARPTSERAADGPGDTVVPIDRWEPGDFIERVDVPTPMMALTIDDGPSPDNTPAVLKALSDRNVKATFFMVGWAVRTWPELAREVVSEGHEIGNHSTEHGPYDSSVLAVQMMPMQQILRDELGVVPVVHRAPGLVEGPEILDQCRVNGMYECGSTMPTPDVDTPLKSADQLLSAFKKYHLSGGFPIYHDGGKRRPTADAIGPIIDAALGFGYELVTATELVNSGTPIPGRPSYVGHREPRAESSDDGTDRAAEGQRVPVPCCGSDARQTLLERLENPSVKRVERSRIVEQLAMLDDRP